MRRKDTPMKKPTTKELLRYPLFAAALHIFKLIQ